jgi:heme/copper-type cytochrome/quinol oxidase subunit 2
MNTRKIGKHKTTVTRVKDNVTVRYWYTDVVTANLLTGDVTLNTGGWQSVTTKARMNQTAAEYNMGFSVYQKNWQLFVRKSDGTEIPFDRSVTFNFR